MSARHQLRLAAHLSRWLADAGLGAAMTVAMAVMAYLAARRGGWVCEYMTPKALAPLLGYLRGWACPRSRAPAPATPAE